MEGVGKVSAFQRKTGHISPTVITNRKWLSNHEMT